MVAICAAHWRPVLGQKDTFEKSCDAGKLLQQAEVKTVITKQYACHEECPKKTYGVLFDRCCEKCSRYSKPATGSFSFCSGCDATDTIEDAVNFMLGKPSTRTNDPPSPNPGGRRLNETDTSTVELKNETDTFSAMCKAGEDGRGELPQVDTKMWDCQLCAAAGIPILVTQCCDACAKKAAETLPPKFFSCLGCDKYNDRGPDITPYLKCEARKA